MTDEVIGRFGLETNGRANKTKQRGYNPFSRDPYSFNILSKHCPLLSELIEAFPAIL